MNEGQKGAVGESDVLIHSSVRGEINTFSFTHKTHELKSTGVKSIT